MRRTTVGGMIGRTFISDQGIKGANCFDPIIRLGKGVTFEGEYSRIFLVAPIDSIAGEVPVVYNRDIDSNAGNPDSRLCRPT
jgi:hypothetical protein